MRSDRPCSRGIWAAPCRCMSNLYTTVCVERRAKERVSGIQGSIPRRRNIGTKGCAINAGRSGGALYLPHFRLFWVVSSVQQRSAVVSSGAVGCLVCDTMIKVERGCLTRQSKERAVTGPSERGLPGYNGTTDAFCSGLLAWFLPWIGTDLECPPLAGVLAESFLVELHHSHPCMPDAQLEEARTILMHGRIYHGGLCSGQSMPPPSFSLPTFPFQTESLVHTFFIPCTIQTRAQIRLLRTAHRRIHLHLSLQKSLASPLCLIESTASRGSSMSRTMPR